MTSSYELVTHWSFASPVRHVWQALRRPEEWPLWWKGVVTVQQLERGDANDVGAYRRMVWRGALPYRLAFNMRTVRVVTHSVIEGVADGELSGRGVWTLTQNVSGGTDVRYDWNVETTKAWMRLLGPMAKPLFEWNHGVVMEWGRRGMEQKLARAT
jgi:uncharacterized protein YndB with AHSA1/START domain